MSLRISMGMSGFFLESCVNMGDSKGFISFKTLQSFVLPVFFILLYLYSFVLGL